MAIMKTLDILLRGKLGTLNTQLDKSKEFAGEFAGGLKGVFQSAFAGISTAFIVGKFKTVISAIDDLGDRAKVFGTSAEELGKLEYAAELSGVSFDNLSAATKFMTLNIAKATDGAKASVELFRSIGTTGEELVKLSLTDRFLKVAQGLSTVDDQAKKTEMVMSLFGRQGLLLLPLLADSGRELARSFADLERYGTVFSQRDAETLGSVNKAFSLLSKTFDAVFGRIAVQIGPALKQIARNMSEAIKPGTFLNGVMRGLGDGLTIVLGVTTVVAGVVRGISEFFGSWTGRLIGMIAISYASAKATQLMATAYETIRKFQAKLLAGELSVYSMTGVGLRKVAQAAGVFLLAAGAIAVFEMQMNKVFADATKQAEQIEDSETSSGQSSSKVNIGSAALGSQEAMATLFHTEVVPTFEKLAEIEKRKVDIQKQIRRGINRIDGVFSGRN